MKTQVCIVGGSGGVGKTTLSAGIGLFLANQGKKVLVMTIDPSKRLKTVLNIDGQNKREVEVDYKPTQGKFFAELVDAESVFETYIQRYTENESDYEKLKENRIYKRLKKGLSGSQEFTSLYRLLELVERDAYDFIILDTPPAQHALEFLQAPKKLVSLFDRSIAKWLNLNQKKKGLINHVIYKSSFKVIQLLQQITGADFVEELVVFMSLLQNISAQVIKTNEEADQLLRSLRVKYCVVSAHGDQKMSEAREFISYLLAEGYLLQSVIFNKVIPEDLQLYRTQVPANEADKIKNIIDPMLRYYKVREQECEQFMESQTQGITKYLIPELKQNQQGLQSILDVAEYLKKVNFIY